MPLSEDEQRILQDIERNFYEQDPAFARSVARPGLYRHATRNCKLAALGFVFGIVVTLGTFIRMPLVAFFGFLIMAVCAGLFFTNLKRIGAVGMLDVAETPQAKRVNASVEGFRTRLRARFTRKHD